MLDQIPTEFGRIIPQPKVRCSQCGRQTMVIAEDDVEPLCSICRTHDRTFEQQHAREAIRELVVPIERGGEAARLFGSGSGEIESCALVLAMRDEQVVDADARLCRRMTIGFLAYLGLILIAAAVLR